MAKRKRLTPANPDFLEPAEAEAKGLFTRPAPIADVARDASSAAALEEMAETLAAAREEGRMVLVLPIAEIETSYLVRDRVAVDIERDAGPEEQPARPWPADPSGGCRSWAGRGRQFALRADLGLAALPRALRAS